MKLSTILSSLTVALLTLGTPAVTHTIEEAHHDVKLLTETCSTGKAKLCAIKPGHTEGGGSIIFECLHDLNVAFDLVQTRVPKTKPFPPEVEEEIEAGVKIFKTCLNEILSSEIPRLLNIPEIERHYYEFASELETLVNQEEVCVVSGDIWTPPGGADIKVLLGHPSP